MTIGKGLVRGEDAVLVWHGGRHYEDPGEALKTWHAGKLRLGCAARIFEHYSGHPCGKTPKHDPDAQGRPTRCGVHCAAAVARRKSASDARFAAWSAKSAAVVASRQALAGLEPALRMIAQGHNDPRALAQEVLAALDDARAKLDGSTDE